MCLRHNEVALRANELTKPLALQIDSMCDIINSTNKNLTEECDCMNGIKNMLLGIAIMVASVALYSIYDSDLVASIIALVGLGVTIYGYIRKE